MNDFEIKKRELMKPILMEAGNALMACQSFEYGMALLLFHLSRLGVEGLDPKNIIQILEDKDKKTAGYLVNLLKAKASLSEGIEESMKEALIARNRIVHRVLIDNADRLMEEEARVALVKEISQLRIKVQNADNKLHPFIIGFSEALDGFELNALEDEVKKYLE